jgi:hypothetical protein
LEGLTFIEEDLNIGGNDALINLSGLEGLTSVEGYLSIEDNPSLNNLTGLNGLSTIGGSFTLGNNDTLNSLGLDSLKSIGGSLSIWENNTLISLDGLESLHTIEQSLTISDNNSLTSLEGLIGLTSLGTGPNQPWPGPTNPGCIYIKGNGSLSSLSGLDNIEPGFITLMDIVSNPILSHCDVLSICEYLLAPGGHVTIEDNYEGCNSVEEVEEACVWVGVDRLTVDSRQLEIMVYPNPANEFFNFQFSTFSFQRITIKIFDLYGREIAMVIDRETPEGEHMVSYDAGSLPAGMYFIRLQAGKDVSVMKLIVQ